MTSHLRVALLVLVACLGHGCSCTYENSADVPGDIHRFDPVAALPAVLTYAGPDASLLSFEVLHARADGTVDLEADYYPGWTVPVTYRILRPTQQRVDPSLPVGARPELAPYEEVEVEVMKPHWRTVDTNGSEWTSKHRGMLASVRGGAASQPAAHAVGRDASTGPGCDLAALWQVARARGAPADAVATIRFDGAGYRFEIPGTAIAFTTSARCD